MGEGVGGRREREEADMRVTDKRQRAEPKDVWLTDIPRGTVFSATVIGRRTGEIVTGVFYKASGRCTVTTTDGKDADVVVVRLDLPYLTHTTANLITVDRLVYDYQPLDVELVIHGAAK
jgi:hypothetical protein